VKHPPQPSRILRLLFWETTIRCNLSCAHCRRIESDRASPADLGTSEGLGLIDQLAEIGQEQRIMPVLVFSGGEPLCREDIFELASHARQAGLTLALATNGTLIEPAVAQKIHDNHFARVSVSLDGATSDVHNKLRQLEGSFEKALEGIGHLRDRGVPFQINITLTRQNCHQLRDVYELARSLGAVALHIFMLVPVGCGQDLAKSDMLSPEEYEQMLLEVSRLDGLGRLQVKVTCGPHYERVIRQQGVGRTRAVQPGSGPPGPVRGCLAGLAVLFVGHKGDVFPCGYLPVKCGNILESRLIEIWQNNEDLARMRDSDNLEGKCGICEYKKLCGGCRARAYAATGNYLAEEPFCAYIPPQAETGA